MKPDARLPSRIPFALLLASIAILTAASAARSDTAWPHAMKTSKGSMLSIYEPSLETLEGDRLSGHAACSVRPAGESDPIFGVFWFTASVTTDKASREVKLVSIDVTQVKFPTARPNWKRALRPSWSGICRRPGSLGRWIG